MTGRFLIITGWNGMGNTNAGFYISVSGTCEMSVLMEGRNG